MLCMGPADSDKCQGENIQAASCVLKDFPVLRCVFRQQHTQ